MLNFLLDQELIFRALESHIVNRSMCEKLRSFSLPPDRRVRTASFPSARPNAWRRLVREQVLRLCTSPSSLDYCRSAPSGRLFFSRNRFSSAVPNRRRLAIGNAPHPIRG